VGGGYADTKVVHFLAYVYMHIGMQRVREHVGKRDSERERQRKGYRGLRIVAHAYLRFCHHTTHSVSCKVWYPACIKNWMLTQTRSCILQVPRP